MKKLLIMTAMFLCGLASNAGETGEIKGVVKNDLDETMPGATVALMVDSNIISAASTDVNGEFFIKNITPGTYSIRVSYSGYNHKLIRGISLAAGQTRYLDIKMETTTLAPIEIPEDYIEPPFDFRITSGSFIPPEKIKNIATGKNDIISMAVVCTPGLIETPDGKDLHIRGARRGTTAYIVDGMRVQGSFNIPGLSVGSVTVLTGGIPAEYGDVSGGIVIINSKDYMQGMWEKKQMIKRGEEILKEKENIEE